jgi:putative hydroxymethylpyrimidine transporter CytX
MVQLVGWTTFELVVMRDGTLAMTQASHWSAPYVATLLWGGVLVLLMMGSMLGLVRSFLSKFGLPLVVLSLVWLSWQFIAMLQTQGWEAFWHKPGNNEKSYMISMELVIAMPVSWLPLIADYARFGKNSRSALTGSWLGYAIANIWCYALGVMAISVSAPDANLVNTLLLAQGGLLALGLILLDEIDNAYGDVYSASVNSHSIWPVISAKQWGILIALLCTALAMVLPMHSLEPFLLMLSSVFVPLFGVILGRMGWGQSSTTTAHTDTKAVLSWLAGIAVYQLCMEYSPYLGYAMPSLLTTLLLGWLTRPVNAKTSLA